MVLFHQNFHHNFLSMIYLGLAHMMGLDLHQHDQMAGPKISKKLLHLNNLWVQNTKSSIGGKIWII